jgi:hypothetical protein
VQQPLLALRAPIKYIGQHMSSTPPSPDFPSFSENRTTPIEQSDDDAAESTAQFELTEAQKRELDRRIAAKESNTNRGAS